MKINFEFDDEALAFTLVAPVAIICIFLLFARGCEQCHVESMQKMSQEQKAQK